MISLDQVQLLEQKVETAVTRIAELQKENEFLREKFSELKVQNDELLRTNNELGAKVSLYEQNQPLIEERILNALECLNNVEDAVLRSQVTSTKTDVKENAEQSLFAESANTNSASPATSAPSAQSANTQVDSTNGIANSSVQTETTIRAFANYEKKDPFAETNAAASKINVVTPKIPSQDLSNTQTAPVQNNEGAQTKVEQEALGSFIQTAVPLQSPNQSNSSELDIF